MSAVLPLSLRPSQASTQCGLQGTSRSWIDRIIAGPKLVKFEFDRPKSRAKWRKYPSKISYFWCHFGGFDPWKFSRVIMGKSRVHHGFVTGSGKPWVFSKPGVFSSKPWVYPMKSRVNMGKSRVKHGFVSSTLDFSYKNLKLLMKTCSENTSELKNPGFPEIPRI